MGEDSDPETGSNAVDDPRDDESEESGGRAPDDAVDSRSDGDAAGADAQSTPDDDGTATAAEDDSTVAQVDLDAGSAPGADPETTEDAESRPSATSEPTEDPDEGSAPADTDASDAAPGNGVDATTTEADSTEPATTEVDAAATDAGDGDAAAGSDSPDGSAPDDASEPVADVVPDPAPAADPPSGDADAADPVGSPDPAHPHPDVGDGSMPDAPATDDTAGEHEPFPAADDADATADAHAPETGSERDLAPVSEDSVEYEEFEAEPYDDVDDGFVSEGPAEDEEMPLADHIEEMIRRLGVVFLIGGVVLIAAFPLSDQIINFLWNAHIPGAANPTSPRRPRLYGPLELILTEIKVAGLAGFVAGLPALVYQSYRFMRPGLYPTERRYYLASVPTSLVLALVGVAFAHFIVLPAIFAYFTSYTANAEIVVAFGLRETFNLILLLMGYMALVFQIPLFMMLAVMMGLVTRQWMTDKRLLFWGAFLGLSFLVSPDPTGMTPIIVAATMIALFEGTLLLIKWTGR